MSFVLINIGNKTGQQGRAAHFLIIIYFPSHNHSKSGSTLLKIDITITSSTFGTVLLKDFIGNIDGHWFSMLIRC